MDVLLIGGGGREDALAWALRRSPDVGRLCCAPGNAGIARHAEIVDLDVDDLGAVVEHVRQTGYGLVVVGPEAPLVAGLVDRLEKIDVPVFGPSRAAARIEGSKIFSKQFMQRHNIPTAGFSIFDDAAAARSWLQSPEAVYPLVIKADGLAAGKGVLMVDDAEAAVAAAETMLVEGRFGDAGSRILVEEHLFGREVSMFVLADGRHCVELAPCQDYKRALDGDAGPNTGGMGSYSPSVWLDEATRADVMERVVRPTIRGMAAEGAPYRGVLYVGLMLTDRGPQVLEYNARFGDPETQALLPRLDGDWLTLLHACATARLADLPEPRWLPGGSVCVVMTAEGYPGSYPRGRAIHGVEQAESMTGVHVFHAGTRRDEAGALVSSGGRVLGVTALGDDISAARQRAYEALAAITWDGEHHRLDIAEDAVQRTAEGAER